MSLASSSILDCTAHQTPVNGDMSAMAIIIILAAFLSTWLILFLSPSLKTERFRVSILKTLVIQASLVAISTEALSSVRALDFNHIALFWALIAIVNSYILYSRCRDLLNLEQFHQLLDQLKQLKPSSQRSIGIVATIAVISLIICLIAPPNNYDSLTYHMTRVMQWIQNRSVEYYPTHNLRQIFIPPGASYIVAHLQILSGGDRYATSVQWFAYIGSILGVSLITKRLFGDRAQWISALISATVPMAIMQSTTAQTDLVTSFWLVCLAYFIFEFQASNRSTLFWISASLSLAILTKPTGSIFAVPLFIILGVIIFRENFQHHKLSTALFTSLKYCTLVGLGGLLLPMPGWARNLRATGNFLGEEYSTRAELHNLAEFASNILKNAALNLPIPGLTQFIVSLHHSLLSVDPNNSRLNFGTSRAIEFDTVMVSPVTLLIPSEDNVANPVHFILGIIALASLFTIAIRNRNKCQLKPLLLGFAVIGNYFLFCYLLKWQPWGNRLLLPLFFLQAPIIAHYLTTSSTIQKFKVHQFVLALMSIVAVVYAVTPIRHPLIALPTEQWSPEYLGYHQSKSILTLERQAIYYSANAKSLEKLHKDAVNTIVDQYQCRTIGFDGGSDDIEYPLWMLLKEKTNGNFRMKHVLVENKSKVLAPEFPDSEVCAILPSRGKPVKVKVVQSQP